MFRTITCSVCILFLVHMLSGQADCTGVPVDELSLIHGTVLMDAVANAYSPITQDWSQEGQKFSDILGYIGN